MLDGSSRNHVDVLVPSEHDRACWSCPGCLDSSFMSPVELTCHLPGFIPVAVCSLHCGNSTVLLHHGSSE